MTNHSHQSEPAVAPACSVEVVRVRRKPTRARMFVGAWWQRTREGHKQKWAATENGTMGLWRRKERSLVDPVWEFVT